jgi:hypothetical protein
LTSSKRNVPKKEINDGNDHGRPDEHARRNLSLRAARTSLDRLSGRGRDVEWLGIFNLGIEETTKIMEGDPGMREGVFAYEVYPCRSFPGDALPG